MERLVSGSYLYTQDMLDSTSSDPNFMNTIITCDESWVYDLETKSFCHFPETFIFLVIVFSFFSYFCVVHTSVLSFSLGLLHIIYANIYLCRFIFLFRIEESVPKVCKSIFEAFCIFDQAIALKIVVHAHPVLMCGFTE